MPVIGTRGYASRPALRAIPGSRHPILPERTSRNVVALESVVNPILVLYAHHLMNDAADRSAEQCRGRPEVAVVVRQLRGRYPPAAEEFQGGIGPDHRDSEWFAFLARSGVTGREVDVACRGVHRRGPPHVGPDAAGRHGVELARDRAGRRIYPDHPAADERAVSEGANPLINAAAVQQRRAPEEITRRPAESGLPDLAPGRRVEGVEVAVTAAHEHGPGRDTVHLDGAHDGGAGHADARPAAPVGSHPEKGCPSLSAARGIDGTLVTIPGAVVDDAIDPDGLCRYRAARGVDPQPGQLPGR